MLAIMLSLGAGILGVEMDVMSWLLSGALPKEGAFLLCGFPVLGLSILLRRFGIKHLHFTEHEKEVDSIADCSLESEDPLPQELIRIIQRIQASEAWERQAVREEAKVWIQKNESAFSPELRRQIEVELGYLWPRK